MKKLTLLATAGLFALELGLGAAVAEITEPPDHVIEILTDGAKKPAVHFNHAAHLKAEKGPKECKVCHHKGQAKVEDMKCRGCHHLAAEGDAVKIQDAMHKKDVGKCRSCHFGKEATAKRLKCSDCHVKK